MRIHPSGHLNSTRPGRGKDSTSLTRQVARILSGTRLQESHPCLSLNPPKNGLRAYCLNHWKTPALTRGVIALRGRTTFTVGFFSTGRRIQRGLSSWLTQPREKLDKFTLSWLWSLCQKPSPKCFLMMMTQQWLGKKCFITFYTRWTRCLNCISAL